MFTYSFQMISWHTMPDTGRNTPIIHNVMYDATQKKEDVNDQTIDGREIDLSGNYIGIKCMFLYTRYIYDHCLVFRICLLFFVIIPYFCQTLQTVSSSLESTILSSQG